MNIYTIQDWEKDGTFKALEGQEIDAAIYYEMRDVMPISPLRRPAYGCKNGCSTSMHLICVLCRKKGIRA